VLINLNNKNIVIKQLNFQVLHIHSNEKNLISSVEVFFKLWKMKGIQLKYETIKEHNIVKSFS